MICRVRDSDQAPVSTQNPRDLRHSLRKIRHVVQHPRRKNNVERRVREGQALNIRDACVHATGSRQLDHSWRLVNSDDQRREFLRHASSKLALTTTNFQHRRRRDLCNSGKRKLACIGPGYIAVRALARSETHLRRVLHRDVRRIVRASDDSIDHGVTIGVPGSLPLGLPPSHAFTVAPTSPNSPFSRIRPAAFLPTA